MASADAADTGSVTSASSGDRKSATPGDAVTASGGSGGSPCTTADSPLCPRAGLSLIQPAAATTDCFDVVSEKPRDLTLGASAAEPTNEAADLAAERCDVESSTLKDQLDRQHYRRMDWSKGDVCSVDILGPWSCLRRRMFAAIDRLKTDHHGR